jgi:hypothetical protein
MKKIFHAPALLTAIGLVFFLLIQWPYLSFLDRELLGEPYLYWFVVWGMLTAFLCLFAFFVERNDI